MGKSSKQDREGLSEVEEKKMFLQKEGENREYREGVFAGMEKEVMAVSFLYH